MSKPGKEQTGVAAGSGESRTFVSMIEVLVKYLGLAAMLFILFLIVGGMNFVGDPMTPSTVGYLALQEGESGPEALRRAQSVAQRYNRGSVSDAHSISIVGAMILDYRGYDTIIESVVLFTALICVLSVFAGARKDSKQGKEKAPAPAREAPLSPGPGLDSGFSPIVKEVINKLLPFIVMFGIYIIFHGEVSPGGGFQGGVVIGAAMVLIALIFGLGSALERIRIQGLKVGNSLGPWIYMATGLVGILAGTSFLAHQAAKVFPHGPFGTLLGSISLLSINIGIGTAVATIIAHIFFRFIGEESYPEEGGSRC